MRPLVILAATAILAAILASRSELSNEPVSDSRPTAAGHANQSAITELGIDSPDAVLDSNLEPDYKTRGRANIESLMQRDTRDTSTVHAWSEPPEEIENRIRSELESGRYGALWGLDVACTETQCVVRYERSDAGNLADRFVEFVRSPYIDASGVSISWSKTFNHTFVYTHEVSTYREPPSYPTLGMTAAELRQFAQKYVSPDDIFASPVDLGDMRGVSLIVENICSIDCPLDLQQVVHWVSTDGEELPCDREGPGIRQAFLVRAKDGSFAERVLCVEAPYD